MKGRPKKYRIQLTDSECQKLKAIIRKNNTSRTVRCRCQIILDLDENHGKMLTYEQCYKSNGICHATVSNTVAGFSKQGISYLTALKRSIKSDNARRKMNGRSEAKVIEVACSPAPEGHNRWTIRLLENEMKMILEEPVSRETIRRTLKKTKSDHTGTDTGASPKKEMPNS